MRDFFQEYVFIRLRDFEMFIQLGFMVIAGADLVLVISTLSLLYYISRSPDESDNTKYQMEKKWLLINLKIFAVMIVTWPINVLLLGSNFDLVPMLTSDFMMLFTSIVIFAILVLRKDVRVLLFKSYRGFQNSEQ
jgi:hypothetical protein